MNYTTKDVENLEVIFDTAHIRNDVVIENQALQIITEIQASIVNSLPRKKS